MRHFARLAHDLGHHNKIARLIACDKRRQIMAKLIPKNANDAPYQGTHNPLKS